MRRVVVALFVALIVPVAPLPAEAAKTGDIIGSVRNETTDEPQAGAKVTLLHLRVDDEEPKMTRTTTDDKGRYEFEDLPTGPEHIYALDVRHQGGLFASGTIDMPDDTKERPVFEADIKVWDTTDDPRAILLRRNDLFASVDEENSVSVLDSYRIINTSDLAYIGRGGAGSLTTVGFPLPEEGRSDGVLIVNQPRLDIPQIRSTEFGFGITVAIPPGQTDLVFSYSVDGTGGTYDLTRTALYPILDSTIYAKEPIEIRSNRFSEEGEEPVSVGDEEYIPYTAADDIDAGDPIQVLAVAEAGMSPWLVVGASVLFGVMALALAVGIVLRRRKASKQTRASTITPVADAPPVRRDELVIAIAELDLRYQSGELTEDEWRTRREELKSRVDERSPEPTP